MKQKFWIYICNCQELSSGSTKCVVFVLKIPCLTRAVQQTPSLKIDSFIHGFINLWFLEISVILCISQTATVRKLKFCDNVYYPLFSRVIFHVSYVTCHVWRVTCHMSHVKCHMSHLTCHVSCVICHLLSFLVECLLSLGLTASSFFRLQS